MTAHERESGSRLNPFVSLGTHRDADLALAVQLEAARVDRTLQQHDPQQDQQLFG